MTFILLMGTVSAANYQCTRDLVNEPPFYVSDEYQQGDKLFENFRNLENKDKSDRYIPRGSIVFVDPQIYNQYDASSDDRVPVQVLSTPSKKAEEALRKGTQARNADDLRDMVSTARGQTRVRENDKGWMSMKSLRKTDDYTFAVEKNSPIYNTPGVNPNRNYYLKLNMQGGRFKVQKCCTSTPWNGQISCVTKYEMTLIDDDSNELKSNYVNFRECNFFDGSLPIKNDQLTAFQGILDNLGEDDPTLKIADLEILPAHQSWSGDRPIVQREELIKIPLDDNRMGPFNSYHYLGDDDSNSDSYLKPNAMCAFTQVLKKWEGQCSGAGCKVMFGDLYHPKSWKSHSSHGSGVCIDLRPFRKSDDKTSGGLTFNDRRYSKDRTLEFVKLVEKAGATPIYFNDPKIKSATSARNASGHANHLHICFPENSAKTLQTCKNGL